MPALSPYDDPVPRGWSLVCGTLRIAVALQCAGVALQLLQAGEASPAVALLQNYEVIPGDLVGQVPTWVGWGMAVGAVLTLLRPNWAVLLPVIVWMIAVPGGEILIDERYVAPAEQAVRFLLPITLLLVDFWPPALKFSIGRAGVALAVLRLGAVTTFVGQAIVLLPEINAPGAMVEQIGEIARRAGQPTLSADVIRNIMIGLVTLELAAAINLLLTRNRGTALLAACVGFVVAAAPVAAYGPERAAESLLLVGTGAAPLVLFFYWLCAIKEQPAIIVPRD